MLQPGRFTQLLRQVHDAEIADVRKLGEDEYEVLARGLDGPPVPAAVIESSANGETAAGTDNVAARGGIRFRRGSRRSSAPPAIAMVGVVSLDEEPAPETPAPKKGGRKKSAKTAAPVAEEAAEAAPAKKKSTGRSRTKKKAE